MPRMHGYFVSRYLSSTVLRSFAVRPRLLDDAEQFDFVRDRFGIDGVHERFERFGDASDAAVNEDFP